MSTLMPKKKSVAAVTKIDLSGLSQFSVVDVMASGLRAASGRPLELSLDDIVEDPDQARSEGNPGFSAESLAELAESIGESKGVKTPISVRSKNAEGKYLINHGARRYRASKLAGMKIIQAFVDDSHDGYDQAVENIQREAFTPMEIALFIQKRERVGDDRAAIAKRLGKSRTFVTRHAVLLELVPDLRALYDSGRTRDYQTLYNLSNLAKEHPGAVATLVEGTAEITRSMVEALKTSLQDESKQSRSKAEAPSTSGGNTAALLGPLISSQGPIPVGDRGEVQDESNSVRDVPNAAAESSPRQERGAVPSARSKKAAVMVSRKKSLFALRIDLAPSALHLGWIEDPATGKQIEVELADLRIDSIVYR